jgi:hypothetical protein
VITADQTLAHFVGDYILQSHWMATEKVKRSVAALCHVITYALPFLFLRPSWPALAVIVGTHFVIDRWRLARVVVWLKNFMNPHPLDWSHTWQSSKTTGYSHDVPAWLSVWLLIIADNIMHVGINGLALKYL